MYLQYFGLTDYPFSVTPDPAFLFLGTPHREALGHLLYGAGEHGGFVQLTGEVGTGKTTLIRTLVDNRLPDLDVALCWHPQLNVLEFVATICDELGVAYDPDRDTTLKAMVDRLNTHLLQSHAEGRRTLLIIDEAQNLSREVLEQLRLLTNLETSKHKLLRVILVGQTELETFLARHDLRQLSQRVSARFTLTSLDRAETMEYINHRLACVGGSARLFSPWARQLVYWHTHGTPRLINLVCERALMGAYAHGSPGIRPLTVHKAAREALPRRGGTHRQWLWPAAAAVAVLFVLTLVMLPPADLNETLAHADTAGNGIVGDAEAATLDADQALSADHNQPAGTATADGPARHHAAPTRSARRVPDVKTEPLLLSDLQTVAWNGGGQQPVRVAAAATSAGTSSKPKETSAKGPRQAGSVTPLPEGDAELSQLLRLWGVLGEQVTTDCGSLSIGNLHCLSEQGTLATLARFNRPAILVLTHDGQQQRVIITELDDNSATLMGAQDTRRIARERLARLWSGRFLMIWRARAGVVYIHNNMIGNAVVWLRKRLARVSDEDDKTPVGPPSPIFDDQLEARVRHFQLMHGLQPDGIAGPRTQIMLNGIVQVSGAPTLKPEPKDEG